MGQKLDRYLETKGGKEVSDVLTGGLTISDARDVYRNMDRTLEISEDDFVIGYLEGATNILIPISECVGRIEALTRNLTQKFR